MINCIQKLVPLALLLCTLTACEPADDRPGFWLSGESQAFPEDWSFTDDVREISVQVETPYFLAHSVTIWCAQLEGTLYVGALEPQSKNWPGWVEDSPIVSLKVADKIYQAKLFKVNEADLKAKIAARYTEKYQLSPGGAFEGDASAWYWRVSPTG